MICISIGEYGLRDCQRALRFCEKVSAMAEIRLDLCHLTPVEVKKLFMESKVPLIATCRRKTSHLIGTALEYGAEYIDIEVVSAPALIKETIELAHKKEKKVILSFHDYRGTPSLERLKKVYDMAVDKGADIVKISTFANSSEDVETISLLYCMVEKEKKERKIPLVALPMGSLGSYSRVESLFYGAPFSYCSLREKNKTADGQLTYKQMRDFQSFNSLKGELFIPSSKSEAQRAIIAASLATGKSLLRNFFRCRDVDAAIGVAKQMGSKVFLEGDTITIVGCGQPFETLKKLKNDTQIISAIMVPDTLDLFVGESGLLSRLCIPIAAQLGEGVTITGEGSLLSREMCGCKEALERLGAKCILTAQETLPAVVSGPLKGGKLVISGNNGSQLISGLLMALPLSKKDSTLIVKNVTSAPYLDMTANIVKLFGIKIEKEDKKDQTIFSISGKQKYLPADVFIEGDWSSAANFLVAGVIFGNLLIKGLNTKSYQADKAIKDVIRKCNGRIIMERAGIRVKQSHLFPFRFDGINSPDLLPILAVLASFCEGTSVLTGVDRLRNKECDRKAAILQEFVKMGMDIQAGDDTLIINGMSLARRLMEGKMLKGGVYDSFGDHRIAMALKIASLGSFDKVTVDGIECVKKSFPNFEKLFNSIYNG